MSAAADRLMEKLVAEAQDSNVTVCELLSEVLETCLLSDEGEPHHVYGLDFCKCLEKCMGSHDERQR